MKLITRYLLIQLFSIAFLFGEFFLFDIHIQHAGAWFDEGHMLIAAIAQLGIQPNEIAVLEEKLQKMENLYPGMSNIWSASVWANHIKCKTESYYCAGNMTDSFVMYNQWQYMNVPFNPQNITLLPLYKLYPLPTQGASSALTSALKSIMQIGKHKLSAKEYLTEELLEDNDSTDDKKSSQYKDISSKETKTTEGTICNLDDVSDPSTIAFSGNEELNMEPSSTVNIAQNIRRLSAFEQSDVSNSDSNSNSGSVYGIYTALGVFLNSYAKIHQPLHVIETFSNLFPHGDLGGLKIGLHLENAPDINNLHYFWDSRGGRNTFFWPSVDKQTLFDEAKRLMALYPPSSFGERLHNHLAGTYFPAIIMDTYKVAKNHVYSEFNWANFTGESLPYVPSECYIKKSQIIADQQIVLAGYRLAKMLKLFARWLAPAPHSLTDINIYA